MLPARQMQRLQWASSVCPANFAGVMKASANKAIYYGRGTGVPHPIDVNVGKRIRMRRLFLGMTQETLAKALGLTFQQIQKYEIGANRVSASRLSAIAGILRVPVSFLFDGLDPGNPEKTGLDERMELPETIELIRHYYAIPDDNMCHQFLAMVKAIARASAAR